MMEMLTLKGLLLIRACLKMVFNPVQTFRYQKDEDKQERKKPKELMKAELLSGEFAREMMETLVTRFFVFTVRDLKEWEEEVRIPQTSNSLSFSNLSLRRVYAPRSCRMDPKRLLNMLC